jgi:cell division protein FtsI (penicillin-binding protein 3)
MSDKTVQAGYRGRRVFVLSVFGVAMASLIARGFFLQVLDHERLSEEGESRHLRVVEMPAHRGMIVDRQGEPAAISTPVDTVWADPSVLIQARERLPELAKILGLDSDVLFQRIAQRSDKEFIYIKRRVNPEKARRVMALGLPGVSLQREYRRFYPMGEVMAHVIGFTNVDDKGQEGMELAYDEWLSGSSGLKRVVKDRLGRVVDDVEQISAPAPGKELRLSIDSRLQYLAYRELKRAVQEQGARSGSVVLLRPQTGEVLAMVNQPSFNPNNRQGDKGGVYRNRAVTDVFEPGSTAKPFVVAAAIDSGRYAPSSIIDTAPGYYRVNGNQIKDVRNYGRISLGKILVKSSNVGASRLALKLPSEYLWSVFDGVGFGHITGSGFPGEAAGLMNDYSRWREFEKATLSFGYGLSVTPLQLAEAYAVLAADGVYHPASFLELDEPPDSKTIMRPETAKAVRRMLQGVVSKEGTAYLARVEGYTVAGKTGTVRKSIAGGYSEDRYIAVFAGMVPAEKPELVAVVMINEPSKEEYYGGLVAAPVFSRIMTDAVRLLDIAPDDYKGMTASTREGGPPA